MVVIHAIGTHSGAASGLEDLGEVAVLVKFQNVLYDGGVGRVRTKIDIVAEGDSHTLELCLIASPNNLELACLTVVADDVGTLVDVVAHDVTVGHGINHSPESVHRHASRATDGFPIEIHQHTGNVAGCSDIDFIATLRQTPRVAVLTVATSDESVYLPKPGHLRR